MSGEQVSDCGPQCDEALRELQRYLDGELPHTALGRIRSHLTECYPCTDRATFEEQLRAIVREQCTDRAPQQLVDRIRTRLHTGDPLA